MIAPQQGASYDEQLDAALATEAAGFSDFVRSDHYLAFDSTGLPGPTDSWITLAGLARETQRVRLGTMVSAATFRYPGPLAISVAQVDAMSGGRITLALGAGWAEQEHRAYGIPFPPPAERFERLEEQLALITGMWKTPVGETFSFDGKHYQLVDCPALPKPVQQPHPPVIVGGTGPRRTPALAARFADEFNLPPFNPPDAAAAAFARVRAACEEIGRDPATLEYSVTLTTVCGTDRAEVERRGAVSPAQFEGADCAGTPDEVLEQLLGYREIGATRAYLRLLDLRDVEQITLLGASLSQAGVLPGVTTASAAGTPSAG
ncbi:MAG TPA: LLM class F420-dependent oxidoreductase [Acidimicrobiia bacterium]|jgi:F420-dependent oxidoreductase-like protein